MKKFLIRYETFSFVLQTFNFIRVLRTLQFTRKPNIYILTKVKQIRMPRPKTLATPMVINHGHALYYISIYDALDAWRKELTTACPAVSSLFVVVTYLLFRTVVHFYFLEFVISVISGTFVLF